MEEMVYLQLKVLAFVLLANKLRVSSFHHGQIRVPVEVVVLLKKHSVFLGDVKVFDSFKDFLIKILLIDPLHHYIFLFKFSESQLENIHVLLNFLNSLSLNNISYSFDIVHVMFPDSLHESLVLLRWPVMEACAKHFL